MDRKMEFILRARRLATLFIKASDEYTSLAAEFKYLGLDRPVEEGGLGPDYLSGLNEDLAREDVLGLFALLYGLLSPLTPEQRANFYKMRLPQGAAPGLPPLW